MRKLLNCFSRMVEVGMVIEGKLCCQSCGELSFAVFTDSVCPYCKDDPMDTMAEVRAKHILEWGCVR
ncbi:MAG: hypothetical protein EOP04_08755 [Proteobacteria bacterium]|nr:MAG: hypothetical protein EOP04_08755 [Pseudomonadota bacterium]